MFCKLAFIIVFIHLASSEIKQSVSRQKCDDFYPYGGGGFVHFDEPSNKGHEDAEPNEFPYMVAVGYEDEKGEFIYTCGGVLIDPKYVLCPAYCVSPIRASWKSIAVYVGKNDVSTLDTSSGRIIANRTIVHPDWKSSELINQIALIELKESVSERPICLWEKAVDDPTPTLLIYDTESKKLWKTPTKLISKDECSKFYDKSRISISKTSTTFCAQETNKNDFKSSSSGPLLIQKMRGKSFVPYLLGLSSVSIYNQDAPTVYENIPSYISWIESTIWSNP